MRRVDIRTLITLLLALALLGFLARVVLLALVLFPPFALGLLLFQRLLAPGFLGRLLFLELFFLLLALLLPELDVGA